MGERAQVAVSLRGEIVFPKPLRSFYARICASHRMKTAVPCGDPGIQRGREISPGLVLALVCALLSAPPALSDTRQTDKSAPYELQALPIDEAIKLDGMLNEPGWAKAMVANGFVQSDPREGEPASDPTEVRVLYDEKNIYIGAQCWEKHPKSIIVTELKRDFFGRDGDMFEVIFDTFNDRRNGFLFGTNPFGARVDMQAGQDGRSFNREWDGVWEVQSRVTEEGWTAEFAIPFKTLRFTKEAEQVWGVNFMRRVRHLNEESCWSPLPRRFRLAKVSLAGKLVGLESIRPGKNLKVKPFVTGSIFTFPERVEKPNSYVGQFGLDMKYGVTPGLTLDFTANTDFSQVEADIQQTNLTRFSLFFPEKREFFLENTDIFHFGESTTFDAMSRLMGGATEESSCFSSAGASEWEKTKRRTQFSFPSWEGLG